MNPRRANFNKLIYGVLIVVLLIPLFLLSQPATKQSPGGQLARLRNQYDLSQADLGQIDPTSETIKLATLGMRGIATNILWDKANYYKKVEDWTSLSATVKQITNLQPNFFTVWDFQAHNLAYNVSVEFDDYRDRYAWVIRGINFLNEGAQINDRDPRYLNRLGWITGQKIGRADESKQFRRMFKEDDEFHGSRPRSMRDNWLVAHEKYTDAVALVDAGAPLRSFANRASDDKNKGGTPVLFFSDPAKALINYADALEADGRFGDVTRRAWDDATAAFDGYGEREIDTSWNIKVRLNDREDLIKEVTSLTAKLDALQPGLREEIKQQKLAKLPAEERKALGIDPIHRTPEEAVAAMTAQSKTQVTLKEVAGQIADRSKREEAWQMAVEAMEAEEIITIIERYREIVNFDYWRARSEAGRLDAWQQARQLTFKAGEELAATHWEKAKELYEQAFVIWDKILQQQPILRASNTAADDLVDEINRYRDVLNQLNEDFPENFILQYVVDLQSNPGLAEAYLRNLPRKAAQDSESSEQSEKKPAGEGTKPEGEGTKPAGVAT